MACAECGTEFTPKRRDQRFCQRACNARFHRYSKTRTCSADECDRPVLARDLCKMHYRRLARAEGREAAPKWDERRRANWKRRYAKSRGADEAESFDYLTVYDRDGWVCGICQDPVDRELSWPDPMSVSLDHVVPVSAGGAHSRANAQCAHLVCNLRKGAKAA